MPFNFERHNLNKLKTAMNYHRLLGNYLKDDLLKLSFTNYLQSGLLPKRKQEIVPIIYLKDGRIIDDIRVGLESCSTYDYNEGTYIKGETIGECLIRYNVSVDDISQVIVIMFDITDRKETIHKLSWTPTKGWEYRAVSEIEV
jgi:hypothetical protein